MANNKPPMGALKAAATPAATPAVVKDRLKTKPTFKQGDISNPLSVTT